MQAKPTVPVNCLFQGCYNPEFEAEIRKCKDKCHEYNQLNPNDRESQLRILAGLLGGMGENVIFTPPFWCDYGYNIFVGDYFYSNHNLIINDGVKVSFGDHVFIAPNCCFTTAEHPVDPEQRKAGLEIARPIGAGSVVSRSIPGNVVAVGVPCRVMREISEEDKYRYPLYNGN